jgi:hypothetical protein
MNESKLPWNADYPVYLTIGMVIGNQSDTISPRDEIDQSEWDALDFNGQSDWLDKAAREWAYEYIEFSWDAPKP